MAVMQAEAVLQLLEAAFCEQHPNLPLDFRTHSALHLISQLPNLTQRLSKNNWLTATVQVVEWVSNIAKQLSKKRATSDPTVLGRSKPPWYNLGGPHCQIGKTAFNALIAAACYSLHVPCFVVTYIAKSHVPDTCKKIRHLLQHSADADGYSR